MVTRDEVVWAYRLFLGREPESETAIDLHRQLPDLEALRHTFLDSTEFAGANKVNWLVRWLHGYWVAAPVIGGRYLMWIDLGDRYVSSACLQDDYEKEGTRFMQAALRPGDVVADVGANLGWFTLVASAIVGSEGRVHAFEPRAETASYLEKTVALNSLADRVRVHRCALSDRRGESVLTWSAATDNPGGSFLADTTPAPDMERQPIPLRMLDDLALPRLDFLKVDVEGAEMRVFRGAQQTLARCRPMILSELHPQMLERVSGDAADAYFSFFGRLGYRAFIADRERWGEQISTYPGDWPWPLINLALLPQPISLDQVVAAHAATSETKQGGGTATRPSEKLQSDKRLFGRIIDTLRSAIGAG